MGGVGMWIKCKCLRCSRIMLEEAFIAHVKANSAALTDEIKCTKCGGEVERDLHWVVIHTKAGAETEQRGKQRNSNSGDDNDHGNDNVGGKSTDSASAACAGPVMAFEQPLAALGSVSGIKGIVQEEETGRKVKVEQVGSGKVVLMSPSRVRCLLEQLLVEDGEKKLSRKNMRESNNEVYWNFVWWCSRMQLPLPLRTTGGAACKEFVIAGMCEEMVRAKVLDVWESRLEWTDGGDRRVSVDGEEEGGKEEGAEGKGGKGGEGDGGREEGGGEEGGEEEGDGEGGCSRRKLERLFGANDMPSTKTLNREVKEEMENSVKVNRDNGEKCKVLFDGLTEEELAGLEVVKNLLVWGNKEGNQPQSSSRSSKLSTGSSCSSAGTEKAKEGEEEAEPSSTAAAAAPSLASASRRESWTDRLGLALAGSLGGSLSKQDRENQQKEADEARKKEAEERATRLPIPGKRMYDVLEEVARLRSQSKWRHNEGPLKNLYQVLLAVCGYHKPEGLNVLDGSFDKLYEKSIARLNLRTQEWMEQSDMDMQRDRSNAESLRARQVFGLLL